VIKQFSFILAFYFLGEAISYLLPFKFPGSVIGMILLFIALNLRLIKPQDIKQVSDFFLKYMALFFIPAGVSVMNYYGLIEDQIFEIIILLLISTILMLGFIGLLVQYFLKSTKDV